MGDSRLRITEGEVETGGEVTPAPGPTAGEVTVPYDLLSSWLIKPTTTGRRLFLFAEEGVCGGNDLCSSGSGINRGSFSSSELLMAFSVKKALSSSLHLRS